MKIFACDLMYGRDGAADLLGLSTNTVRNASRHVRTYLAESSNIGAAIALGWLLIPQEYLR